MIKTLILSTAEERNNGQQDWLTQRAGVPASGDVTQHADSRFCLVCSDFPARLPQIRRAPVVTQSTIVSDNASGNSLIDIGDTLSIGTAGAFSDADGDTAIPETYQWQANGADIAGATGNTYTIVARRS